MPGRWKFWGHPLFGAGWRRRGVTAAQDDTAVDRLERRALPVQPARRRRKLRAPPTLPFLGVVTFCTRDDFGNTTITGRKLTDRFYAFQDGEEFAAFAGVDAMLFRDSMVIVFPLESLADDSSVKWYARPHIAVQPTRLEPPPNVECVASFDAPWYVDPEWAADPCLP